MDPNSGEDLGRGVYVSLESGGMLTVLSSRVDFDWRVAEGRTPGTAVLWREHSYEVVGRVKVGSGARWTLRRWDEPSTMRGVFKLNRGTVQEMFDRAVAEARGQRTRKSTLVLMPFLGLAPAGLQKKWANSWGFGAERATQVSAICEMLFGAFGIIQVAASAFGGEPFMPSWLAYPGVVLFATGFARLALVAADGEPVGSVLCMPLLPFTPRPVVGPLEITPKMRSYDEAAGVLVLTSPVHRRDWDRDGLLRYRGKHFRLERMEQEGRTWVYDFTEDDTDGEGRRKLRLMPPPSTGPEVAPTDEESPSFLRTMLITAAVTLGPASDQERWANELKVRAKWLTVMGGAAELVGGIANLQTDLGPEQSLLAILDFFLVGEGLLRLGSALVGRPMGSVFGWILRPLYRPWLPTTPSQPPSS